jgi:hypothetical protein
VRPSKILFAVLCLGGVVTIGQAQTNPSPGRLSADGVGRATAQVDSVFVDRSKRDGRIDGGDWASYLLARLGAGRVPDSLGVVVAIDTSHIEVRGRIQDLPAETRRLLGSLSTMVDSTTVIAADVTLQRTGPEVIRFRLRGLKVNGFPFPDFLLGPMMASIGRQYPALTATGRDLYVQVPADGRVALGEGVVMIAAGPGTNSGSPGTPPPRGDRR